MMSERWRIEIPELPETMLEMLVGAFGWIPTKQRFVYTGNVNARLQLQQGVATILVRAHKHDRWHAFLLGPQDELPVIRATWDFLRRHDTPSTPKPRRKPPRSVFRAQAIKRRQSRR